MFRCLPRFSLSLLLVACSPGLLSQAMAKAPKALHFTQNSDPLPALPAPPQPGSLAASAELELCLQVQNWRTPELVAQARKVDAGTVWDYLEVLGPGFNAQALPATARLLAQAGDDVSEVTRQAKDRFARKRPPFTDPRIRPCVKVSDTGSYPSGHASQIFAGAYLLAELFPDRREALLELARRSAWTRIIAGAHYPTDVEGGRLLAETLVKGFLKDSTFQALLEAARTELKSAALSKAS